MKIFSHILALVFVAFLGMNTLDCLIDGDIDIPIVYNANEEESSSKNQINFEYTYEEIESNYESIHFLQTRREAGFYYLDDYYGVFLSITSPPPKNA
ncbi:hypothetical protein MKO06_04555 [Gramella sp. GC03-9]|uniref:Uncharacterized protein n=1 Tax=Christiangramia oceanisediminis TaxID=2920386 RepID=A0A9X2KVG6_9FLAO|nr:hypothetical protein [Gramella oceanisediminis]MCP9199167.1 hypothetical protein [Gramella oceanisediminis]